MSNSNVFKNINTSINKENNSSLNNIPSKQISTNNSFQKKYNNKKKEHINKASLIKKCHMKFSSLYTNPLSQSTYNNINKIKVKKNNFKVFSPLTNVRNNNKKFSNKNNETFNKIKNLKNNIIISPNYFKDINYIKYININIDIDKIKYIQLWWKYIHKVIILQKNIRTFLIKKGIKLKLKNYKFIMTILRIFYIYFINNINKCYQRFYLKKWKEISNKRNIIYKLLLNKKLLIKEKTKFVINNSFQNKLIYDNKKIMTLGNIKNMVFNNSICFKDKILSPYRQGVELCRPTNIKINIKKSKNYVCNIYSRDANNSLNKSLTNQSYLNRQSTNRRSKSNNKVITHIDNQSFHFDEKTEVITNNLYQNIKEYYNINETNANPSISTINFYPSKLNKKNTKNNNTKKSNNLIDSNNTCKSKKKAIISNKKKDKGNYNGFYKSYKNENWIPYQQTFGNFKINENKLKNNYLKNKYNKITYTAVISPASNSNRKIKRNKNKSLELDNDINSIKFLLKFKRAFLHWKNIIIKQKLIQKLRLISKIKHIISVYKLLYIKIFFSKIIQNIYKNVFYQNKINFNHILLNQYYNKLKEISKKKKLINDINIKLKKGKVKEKNFKSKKYENKNKKNNINFTESNATTGLYYATQFNQKFNKLLNDKKGYKNNNIIIINNNINNNCQQLINNVKQSKDKGFNTNYYYRKTVNNNSMIDMQPTDISLSCTMDLYNQSDKSLNSILMNQLTEKQKNLINQKNKLNYLYNLIKVIYNIQRKKVFKKYLNRWKINVIKKKCILPKNNMIDEKIIHFPKSPSPNNINNYNLNNYSCNYMNNVNYTYNNTNINDISNNINYTYNSNDLILSSMLTEDNIKNTKKILYGNNNTTLLRNKMFTPSNKFSFYTQYQNNESNNFNFINSLPARETEPKIVYHKKLFPSFGSSNFKQNNNSLIIDYNYNKEEINTTNNISFNNNKNNNIHYGNNTLNNFYSSNNFFNQRNNYHLENIDKVLPEDKYGFKKVNKIEEREISFSPSLSRKNHSFKNVIKDNFHNINNNNIYINVVENFRSDYENGKGNNNINNLDDLKKNNYQNNYYPIKRNLIEEDNLKRLMCHSHSQGFTRTIQRIFGNTT